MDLTTTAQIVGIVGGIIAILGGIKELGGGKDKNTDVTSNSPNTLTKLMIAAGIVAILYGGFVILSTRSQTNSWLSDCIGSDRSFNHSVLCEKVTTSKYNRIIQPGLLAIGISFILIASALFVGTLKAPSVIMFTFELLWLIAGGWLIFRII